ncbi:MAG: hypothetical protein ACLP5H_12235 [Desulfomonilaceae bacterium]
MIARTGFAVLVGMVLAMLFQSPAASVNREGGSIKGLWRLASVMPAGVLSEERPEFFDGYLYYWFLDDGSVTLLNDTAGGTKRQRGMWQQRGDQIVIIWESGLRLSIRVVKSEKDSIILTGFDVRPLWFRFIRFF